MLKNLASLRRSARVVRNRTSFASLETKPQSPSFFQDALEFATSASRYLRGTSPEGMETFTNITSRRHCMGPSVGVYDTEKNIRKFRFNGKCPTLTSENNSSNSGVASEVVVRRAVSCPHRTHTHSMTTKSNILSKSGSLHSRDNSGKNILKSNLTHVSNNDAVPYVPHVGKTYAADIDSERASRETQETGCSICNVSLPGLDFRHSVVPRVKSPLKPLSDQDENKNESTISRTVSSRRSSVFSQNKERNAIDYADSMHTGGSISSKNSVNHSKNNSCNSKNSNRKQNIDSEFCTTNNVDSVDTTEKTRKSTLNSTTLRLSSPRNCKSRDTSSNLLSSAANRLGNGKESDDIYSASKNLHYIASRSRPNNDVYGIKSNSERKEYSFSAPKAFLSGKPSSNPSQLPPKKGLSKTDSASSDKSTRDIETEDKPKYKDNFQSLLSVGKVEATDDHKPLPSFNVMKQVSSFAAKTAFSPTVLDRFRNREKAMDRNNSTLSPPHNLYFGSFSPVTIFKDSKGDNVSTNIYVPRSSLSNTTLDNIFKVKSAVSMIKKSSAFLKKKEPLNVQRGLTKSSLPNFAKHSTTPKSILGEKNSSVRMSTDHPHKAEDDALSFYTSKAMKMSTKSGTTPDDGLKKSNKPSDSDNTRSGSKTKSPDKTPSTIRSADSIFSGTSATFLEQLFWTWRKDPNSVHPSWANFFKRVTEAMSPPTFSQVQKTTSAPAVVSRNYSAVSAAAGVPAVMSEHKIAQQVAVQNIALYFQTFGHFRAEIDPLQLSGPALGTKFVRATDKQWPPEVMRILKEYKMSDLKEPFFLPVDCDIGKPNETTLPLGEILNRLQDTYCRYTGIEYMHVASPSKRKWLRQQFEKGIKTLTPEEKKKLWKRLMHSSYFETFLTRKWPTTFRFSLEGGEILIPVLHQIIDRCAENDTHSVIMGMAHRGRLNVLANILNPEMAKLLTTFKSDASFGNIVGDVKYHLGCYVAQKHEGTNKDITICILSNPSHLESVNPILQGRCKAEQILLNDKDGKKVVPIIIHGDAAFAGQGCVYENNTLCSIPEYDVHGTIHIVVNNNIGFTALPHESRSSPYCTDIAKLMQAPVFHCNSEKPDDVMHAVNVACAYRNQFHTDVVLDLVCYRRFGHNEADEPAYTSPILYSHIRSRKPWPVVYTDQLIKENVITQNDVEKEKEGYFQKCEEAFKKSQAIKTIDWRDWNDSPWKDFAADKSKALTPTGVSEDTLKKIAFKTMEVPEGFDLHKLLKRLYQHRKQMIESGGVDWALAESLAFGSLLLEGIPVRLSGQDAERGTFSHRHHVLHHQTKAEVSYVPLNHLNEKQAKYDVLNTPLIEYGALAFETGYAMSFANAVTIFEGQYGDFINNAQLMFDVYLSCGEIKWGRQCGIVILAPHGMEGAGSEHSSARLERFLQMSSESTDVIFEMNKPDFSLNQLKTNNWIVANCTTPANFFHILRRQVKMPFRKPLIIMSPKSLLRHPECKSTFDDIKENTSFKSVIPDNSAASKDAEKVQKHILCSGRVYYDLTEARKKSNLESKISITRIEQLTPFPYDIVWKEINKYKNAEICWAQEEHRNQGAWNFVFERLNALLVDSDWYSISYAGRDVSSVTACGTSKRHNEEKTEFINEAMTISNDIGKKSSSKPATEANLKVVNK